MTEALVPNRAMRSNMTNGIERIHNMPRARVWRNAAVNTAAAIHFITAFDNVEYDNEGMWSAGAPSRVTVQTSGLYLVNGEAQYNAPNVEDLWTQIKVNGVNTAASVTQFGMGFGFSAHANPTGLWPAVQGDYFELDLFTLNNPVAVFTGAQSLYLQVCMISTL